VHVDRVGELGTTSTERPKLDDLTRFWARDAERRLLVGHGLIMTQATLSGRNFPRIAGRRMVIESRPRRVHVEASRCAF
jgi:hypothetical protein